MELDLIYDVGMHVGRDTAYYLSRGYRVVAIEADPELVAEQQVKHADDIRDSRLVIINCVIGPETGTARFWLCENRSMSTLDEDIVRRSQYRFEPVELPCRSLRSIFRDLGVPWYLKVDIEGSDHYCLRDIDPTDAPEYVSFELLRLDDLLLLSTKGYSAFKCISQDDLKQLKAPGPGIRHAVSALKEAVKHALRGRPWLYGLARSPLALKRTLTVRSHDKPDHAIPVPWLRATDGSSCAATPAPSARTVTATGRRSRRSATPGSRGAKGRAATITGGSTSTRDAVVKRRRRYPARQSSDLTRECGTRRGGSSIDNEHLNQRALAMAFAEPLCDEQAPTRGVVRRSGETENPYPTGNVMTRQRTKKMNKKPEKERANIANKGVTKHR